MLKLVLLCCLYHYLCFVMYITETGDVKASIAVLSYTITSVMLCIFQRLMMLKLVLLCCLYHYLCYVMYISETGDVKASIAVLSIPLPLFCYVYFRDW